LVAVSLIDAKAAKEKFPAQLGDKHTTWDRVADHHAKWRALRAATSAINANWNSLLARSQKTSVRQIDRIGLGNRMKNVAHSLVSSVTATTLCIAFYIVFLIGLAWLVRADIVFLK
jgi:hypothetical protein